MTNNKNGLEELLSILQNCSDQASDKLTILSTKLTKAQLTPYDINCEETGEGIRIDLSQQIYKIYKNKEDALTYFDYSKGDHEYNTIIIQEGLLYIQGQEIPTFFGNLFFSQKMLHLMISKKIVSYQDITNQILIFLSEHLGKVEVGYHKQLLNFCNKEDSLSELYQSIEKKCHEHEYLSLFRDNFLKRAINIDDINDRFYQTLASIKTIFDDASREFELYKNKFSFEQFRSSFKKEQDLYLKDIQQHLLDFTSKINTLPIPFGVYLFLVFRFQGQTIPLVVTIVLIVAWGCFSIVSLGIMKKTITFVQEKFNNDLEQIAHESGIQQENFSQNKEEIANLISNMKQMIKAYTLVVVIFSVILIVFIGYDICTTIQPSLMETGEFTQ